MSRDFRGRWQDDNDSHVTEKVGWGTIIFLLVSVIGFAWMAWPEVKCWWRGICG